MATNESTNGVPPDVQADAKVVSDSLAAGKPVPPDVAQRVQDRAAQLREQIRQTHGVHDLATSLIREMRGPLDDEQARELTLSQADVLRRGPKPWRLKDPETGEEFVLVPAADYERLVNFPTPR
jgi:hypothetical protein